MKKLLVVLALLTVSTLGYAKEVVSSGDGYLFIVDGKKVYFCNVRSCRLVSSDYAKPKK